MAEAAASAFGAVFGLRGKGHSRAPDA